MVIPGTLSHRSTRKSEARMQAQIAHELWRPQINHALVESTGFSAVAAKNPTAEWSVSHLRSEAVAQAIQLGLDRLFITTVEPIVIAAQARISLTDQSKRSRRAACFVT